LAVHLEEEELSNMPSSSLKWRIQRTLIFSVLELIATLPFAFVFKF